MLQPRDLIIQINHPKPLTRRLALAVNDNIYRLTNATHPEPADPLEQFTYDMVGNRVLSHLSSTHIVDAANRLLEDDTYTYAYDLNGNLTSKTDKITSDVTQYTWTVENKLRSVQKPDGEIVIFRYDGLGRRIEKRTEVGGVVTSLTRYIADGEDILLETDASGNITRRYTHGPGIDEPLVVEIDNDVDGTFDESAYYHTDGLGSVSVLTDTSGNPVKTYRYDAFGSVLEETGTIEQAYSYTGREWDSETGMYYYRARYYDAVMGRFLAEDPIGLAGGINFYAYVGNNPVNWNDPFGLQIGIDIFPNPTDKNPITTEQIAFFQKQALEAYLRAFSNFLVCTHEAKDTLRKCLKKAKNSQDPCLVIMSCYAEFDAKIGECAARFAINTFNVFYPTNPTDPTAPAPGKP